MRKLLLAATIFLTISTTMATATDCGVVNQVCDDMGEMVYNMCLTNGGSLTQCAADEANYRISCKAANGCPVAN